MSTPIISTELGALRALDQATLDLRERNAQRVQVMKESMGRRFVLHPDNAPRRKKYVKVLKAV